MEEFILEKNSQIVLVEGRRFKITEMSLKDYMKYSEAQQENGKKIAEAIKKNAEALRSGSTEAADLEDMLYFDFDILANILEPADGGERISRGFASNLSFRQKKEIFNIQDRVNGVDDVLKKMQSMIAELAK